MSIFSSQSRPTDLQTLKRDRLIGVVMRLMAGVPLSDDYLWEKLLASEDYLEKDLRIFFSPREIVPDGTDQSVIDALVAAGSTVVIEPGYDYTPELFDGDTWGRIELRQRLIIAIDSIVFNYPQPGNALFTIPNDWVRVDRKYGVLNMVPTQNTLQLPLDAFLLSALGGGRNVPLMLQIRYSCGLQNARQTEPALIDLIFKNAVLMILDDQFFPQSSSISQDGGSQSLSIDAEKYRETIDGRIEKFRTFYQGIMLAVM